jgi:hypothetical protein
MIARWFPPLICPATGRFQITLPWILAIGAASILIEAALPLAAS